MKTKEIILVSLFAALTAVGAFVKISIIPTVPFTLQFFFCAFAGVLLSKKLATISQLLYVLIGLVGIPVFTEGGGIFYFLKPTFGFILGLILCSFVIGFVIEKFENVNFLKILFAVLCGLIVLYLIGIPYLYYILNFYMGKHKPIYAILSMFIPFFVVDIIKSVIVSIIATRLYSIFKNTN